MRERWTKETWSENLSKIMPLRYPQRITNEWVDEVRKDPEKMEALTIWGFCFMDLSNYDLSELDKEHMELITFGSSTIWPDKKFMPAGFDPEKALEQGKSPRLNFRELHAEGITGKGVIVATIDSGFLNNDHIEFKNSNIKQISLFEDVDYHFHASGVLANLCGKSVGVAPDVECYHYNHTIGIQPCQRLKDIYKCLKDISCKIDQGIDIRAVNVSGAIRMIKDIKTEEEINIESKIKLIIDKLKSKDCEVIDSGRWGENFGFCSHSYNKEYNKDNLDKARYDKTDNVLFVCSGKVTPEFATTNDYKIEQESCASWTIPQAVGMYALALQVDPSLTWEDYVEIAKATTNKTKNGINLANPKELIKAVELRLNDAVNV